MSAPKYRNVNRTTSPASINRQEDCAVLSGKRILIVDDVISTGESLAALEELIKQIDCEVVGKACVLAEGDAKDREDIIYLEPLPLFFK